MPRRANLQKTDRIRDFLKEVGLGDKEAHLYLSSLKLGNALVKDIAKQAGLNRTTAYNLLLELRKQGLVSSYQKRGLTHFSVVSPDRLRDVLKRRIEEQERMMSVLGDLMPELKGLYNSQLKGANVQMYDGIESLANIYYWLYGDARYPDEGLEIANWGGKFELFPTALRNDLLKLVKERKIFVRSLLVEDENTRVWKAGDGGKSQNKEIRLLKDMGWDFFANIELCRNKIAIVTYRDDVNFHAVLIESRELAAVFKLLFEALWKQTSP